jgi:hypothetical protein
MSEAASVRAPESQKRSFLWWVSAVLAPVGVIGGPLAIADMLAGAIEWNGWIGYTVAWWDENVGTPFGQVISALFAAWGWPELSETETGYLIIGILLSSSMMRAFVVLSLPSILHEIRENRGVINRLENIVFLILWPVLPIMHIAIWPLTTAALFASSFRSIFRVLVRKRLDPDPEIHEYELSNLKVDWLTLAPFTVFLSLWAINLVAS